MIVFASFLHHLHVLVKYAGVMWSLEACSALRIRIIIIVFKMQLL